MKKLEVCPYNKEITCKGIANGLCDSNCILHPFYNGDGEVFDMQRHGCPFNKDITCANDECSNDCYYRKESISDYNDDDSEYDEMFNEAWNLGFKKGYLERLQEEDEELCEEEWCDCRALGYSQGLDKGYIDGYRDCMLGKPCFIENEGIEHLQKLKKR